MPTNLDSLKKKIGCTCSTPCSQTVYFSAMASVASQPAADVSEPTTDVSVVTCGLEWTIGGMEGSGQSTRDRHRPIRWGVRYTGSVSNCQRIQSIMLSN